MGFLDRYKHRETFVADELSAIGYVPTGSDEAQSRDKNLFKRLSRHHGLYFWRTYTSPPCEDALLRSQTLAQAIAEALDRQIQNLVIARAGIVFTPDQNALLSQGLGGMGIRLIQAEDMEVAGINAPSDTSEQKELPLDVSKQWSRLKRLITIRRKRTRLGRPSLCDTNQTVVSRILELSRMLPRSKWRSRNGRIVKRHSPQQIADVLNQEGLRRAGAKLWTDDAVRNVLKKHRPNWLK